MRVDLLTLHPELCRGPLDHSIIGRAQASGKVEVLIHDIRDFGIGRHRSVDDSPYGGGVGMVMRVDVVAAAVSAVRRPDSHVVLMDPAGSRFCQADAVRLSLLPHLILLCGHYEGIDGRVRSQLVDEAISIGDFVLTGGELAALVVADAVVRLLPGVLGNPDSARHESFAASEGGRRLLEAPQYTRPREWQGQVVPDVLLSGNHQAIDNWRREQALELTRRVRPDLLGDPTEGGGA